MASHGAIFVGGTGIEPVTSSVSGMPKPWLAVARWALTCNFVAQYRRAWLEIGSRWLLVWLFNLP